MNADTLRAAVVVGYVVVATLSLYAAINMSDLLRRLIAAGIGLAAIAQLSFYAYTAPLAFPNSLTPAVIYSRVAEIPQIGVGIAVVWMLIERDALRREAQAEARKELAEWEVAHHG